MIYKINKSNYLTFEKIEENRLEHRSYFIPFHSSDEMKKTTYLNERYQSDAVLMLSGEWDFAYYNHSSKLKKELDTQSASFDKIHVPSTWQKTGYDKINYLNSMYPFRCNPPKTPKNCPVGVYRKTFQLKKCSSSTYIVTFLGVAASLDLYVNGEYVGYSEGSHNSAEFDLTTMLENGENELLAVVHKWSTGTYLECQDMFRENGIFRDVYITEMPKSYIFDFKFTCEKNSDATYSANINVKIKGAEKAVLSAELLYDSKKIAATDKVENEVIRWDNLNVIEWNGEIPTCYELILSLSDDDGELQSIRQTVGFCTIKIEGCKYLFNGKPIKLKGVNHHDSHPVRGYAMTTDDLRTDIELMKKYNVNCLRTSHYPPDPIMIAMCDRYGIYVVDEADIETHGCFIKNIDLISNDPKWESHYIDRVDALYERDKNHPSIVMWSMGNEAGGIKNFDACYEYLKERTYIPVHYEPACRSERVRYDILAHFYTPPEEMRGLSRGEWKGEKNYDAPFFLCEYAHSMGVGPGALDEYWDVIYSDERFLGGCIWEWADHAHYDENAKYQYTYGGDHKDRLNSGNFCCDGLFYPDRTPSSAAKCMKNVYRPLIAKWDNGNIKIINTNRFASSENISIRCCFLINGEVQEEKLISTIIAPQESITVPLFFTKPQRDDSFLIFEYVDKKTGELIGKEQLLVNEAIPSMSFKRKDILWSKGSNSVSIGNEKCSASWNKKGELVRLTSFGGEEILPDKTNGFAPMLYQAVIDNHVYAVKKLKKAGLNKIETCNQKMKHDDYLSTVTSTFSIKSNLKKLFFCEITYKAISQSEFIVTYKMTSKVKKPLDMLQVGLTLPINGEYENVRYYGMGDEESYSDFQAQNIMGIYNTTSHNMYVHNIKPQESGNRNGVRWAEITNDNGNGIKITALESALDFKAVDVCETNLRKAKHREDVIIQDTTTLHINGFMRGIGSQSCGPDTCEKYKKFLHYNETFAYSFLFELI